MRLHVGNVRFGATEEELRRLFELIGKVFDCIIIRDQVTNRSRGFGFVEMPDESEARIAIEQLNGAGFRGLPIRVGVARPRGERWLTGVEEQG